MRLAYIRDHVAARFGRDPRAAKPFEGLRFLDIGCGGGLLSEPMARLGASVMGADASATNIEVAKLHAAESGVRIDYRAETAETLAEQGEKFDVILNMEVVEHVSDVDYFIGKCAEMLEPGGIMFVATINRTLKALGLAIIGAEYLLRWLPRGTHRSTYRDRRTEVPRPGPACALDRSGVSYHLADEWRLSVDMNVNYMLPPKRARSVLILRKNRQRHDGHAFLGKAANIPAECDHRCRALGLAIMDLAGLLGETLADILGIGANLLHRARTAPAPLSGSIRTGVASRVAPDVAIAGAINAFSTDVTEQMGHSTRLRARCATKSLLEANQPSNS